MHSLRIPRKLKPSSGLERYSTRRSTHVLIAVSRRPERDRQGGRQGQTQRPQAREEGADAARVESCAEKPSAPIGAGDGNPPPREGPEGKGRVDARGGGKGGTVLRMADGR